MNNSNKVITASIISLMVLAMPIDVLAQGRGAQDDLGTRGSNVGQQVDAVLADDVVTQGRGMGSASQSLSRVSQRNNNPEVGEQIRSMVQNHEQVQVRTKTALGEMNERNAAVKLLIGPDYKNAGQVRSDVVGLRNDISKLEKIREEALPEDVADIQGAVDELQIEADDLEVQLEEQLSGVSLFGWLARMFAR